MAVSQIEQEPKYNNLPVGQPIVFVISNNDAVTNQSNVKFTAKVFISAAGPPSLSNTNKLIGICMFTKSTYWWCLQETMIIHLIYVVPEFRNFKLMNQLLESVKQVSDNNPILLSITSKLEADKLFEKLGFENMGANWRLK